LQANLLRKEGIPCRLPAAVQGLPGKGLIYRLTGMAEGDRLKAELRRGLKEHGRDTRSSSLAWCCRLCRAHSSFSRVAVSPRENLGGCC